MSQFNLLLTSRFLPLFCTQFLGALNDNVYKNALVIFIAFTLANRVAMDGTILVVIASGLFILPFFLFSATAGQMADKYEKALLIRYIKAAEIIIMCLAAIGFITQSLILLMTVLFLMGTQSTFFGPLKYGILPQHLQVNELIGGNGMIQMGTYLAILVGTIIGGVLIAMKSAGTLLVSATVITLAVAGWLCSRRIPRAEAMDRTLKMDWNILRQTWLIMRYSCESKGMLIIIIAISWFWFIGATFLSLVPSYTRNILNGNELVATLLLFAFSVGIGSGSLFCEKLSRSRIEPGLVPLGAAGLAIFPLDLFFIGSPELLQSGIIGPGHFIQSWSHIRVLFDLIMIGFCGGLYIVPLYAMIQHRSSPDHRARVIASANILNALFMVISALLVMLMVRVSVGITEIFFVVSILNVIIVTLIFHVSGEFLVACRNLVKSWLRRDYTNDLAE